MDQVSAHARSGLWVQARLLLWLKWKTGTNALRQDRARLVATLVGGAVLLLAVGAGGSFGLWYGLRLAPEAWQQQIVHAVLAAVLLFWLLSPLVAVSLSEGLDLARLFRLPISPRNMLGGIVLGSFIDLAPIAVLPALLAAALSMAPGWIPALAGVILVITFLSATILFSQVITALAQRFLLSRAGRELLLLLAFAITLAGAIVFQALGPLIADAAERGSVVPLSRWLIYLPSGWAAEGLLGLSRGQAAPFLSALAGLLAIGATGLMLGGWIIRSLLGREVSSGSSRRARKPGRFPFGALPAGLGAVAQKEWSSLLRGSAGRIGLVTAAIFPLIFPLLLALQSGNTPREFPYYEFPIYAAAGLIPIVLVVQFGANTFAYDAEASRTLFTLPLPPWIILAGKNLAVLAIIAALGGASLAVAGLILGRPGHVVPAFVAMLGYGAALLGFANLLALLFPKKLAVTALQNNPVPLPSFLLFLLAAPVIAIPVAAGVTAFLVWGIAAPLVMGGSLVICAAIYAAGLIASSRMLPGLQERVVENLSR